MNELRYTLLTDGSSDRALLPILAWLLREYRVQLPVHQQWADLRGIRDRPTSLAARIRASLMYYPCDLMFIHRDAESAPYHQRRSEIVRALDTIASESNASPLPPVVPVVPVRMQEAWLLVDAAAIRRAAGNPSGEAALLLPSVRDLEGVADPKRTLHELLRQASGLHGRRRRKFSEAAAASRVADLIRDFSPLRQVPAFRSMEAELASVIRSKGWDGAP